MKTKHHRILSTPTSPSGNQPRNNSIRRSRRGFSLSLGGVLVISVCALSPSPLNAGCQQWDVSGQWTIHQGSYTIPVAITQNDKTITGTATQVYRGNTVHGQVNGTVQGDNFHVQISWAGGGAGVYSGTISKNFISGATHDKNNPSRTGSWVVNGHFKCAEVAINQPNTTSQSTKLRDQVNKASAKPATTPSQLPVVPGSGGPGSGTKGGFIQMFPTTPTPTPTADAEESSSSGTEDRHGKHKKKKKNKKKHDQHDHDDNQEQGNY